MVGKYLNHVRSKSPHHRRQHAAQIATLVTALAFVGWITTLGMRFGGGQVAQDDGSGTSDNQTLIAGAAGSDFTNQTGIEVSGAASGGTSDGSTNNFSNYGN